MAITQQQLIICYHGTNRQSAKIIKKEGFKPYTYFGKHLEDAVFYGGEYIFEVVFPSAELSSNWQFIIKDWLTIDRIVGHYRLKLTKFYDNDKLREEILNSNLAIDEAKLWE